MLDVNVVNEKIILRKDKFTTGSVDASSQPEPI